MFSFLLLWLIAMIIVFSFEVVLGLYFYKFTLSQINNKEVENFVIKKRDDFVDLSSSWLLIFWFLNGLMTGWVIESRLKNLSKLNKKWQETQPDFYKKTPWEFRILLPWLVVESPLFIIIIANLFLIFIEKETSEIILRIMIFSFGFVIGQLIEPVKHYKNTVEMDKPEKAPESILQKVAPNFDQSNSLFLGQLYCKIFLPFFFFNLFFLIPSFYILIPYNTDLIKLETLLAIILGMIIRWFYYPKDTFYFSKITIFNVLFITLKNSLSILAIFLIIILTGGHLISIAIISFLVGFILPWHPDKLR
ncbi:MAG: hypothetical protein U0457_12800 [Candidatus Sericytochromatia bacterium]